MPVPKTGQRSGLIPKTPFHLRPNFKELSAKGGRVKSKAKTLANTIKGLKTASEKTKQEHFHKLLTNPEYSLLDILKYAEKIELKQLSDKDSIAYLNTKLKAHQTAHGTKTKIEHTGTLNIKNALQLLEQDDTEPTRN